MNDRFAKLGVRCNSAEIFALAERAVGADGISVSYSVGGASMHRIIAVAIVALAAAFSCPARAEVLIGVAGPMTGQLAWIGEQMQRGAEMAVADINAAGGVLGQQVRLITADDFCDPEQAVAAAQKLVS